MGCAARRHFLEDMFTTIMPGIITRLARLSKFLVTCTEAHVQMTLTVLPSVANSTGRAGDKVIDCGNLVNVVNYLAHYFSKTAGTGERAQVAANAAGSGPAAAASSRRPLSPSAARAASASPEGFEHATAQVLSREGHVAIAAPLSQRYLAPHGISTAADDTLLRGRGAVPMFALASAKNHAVLDFSDGDDSDDAADNYY
jgi:hypothetical protein